MKQQVKQHFNRSFGHRPAVIARAPGRLEILGNHTDYNEGVVLSVAVDRATYVAAGPSGDDTCRVINMLNGETAAFSFSDLSNPVPSDWSNYVKGLLVEFRKRGIEVPPFEAVETSTVPMAAGMSSSAALEMSFALALVELADADMSWQELARIGQACENEYVGANTGLLDQFSSLQGRAGSLVLSDFRTFEVNRVPLPSQTALVVADSKVTHNLAGEYNERRQRCEEAAKIAAKAYPGITSLRDVTRQKLEGVRGDMNPVTYRRALHIVGENDRVQAGVRALEHGDLATFGQLMLESHESSRMNFENSCPQLDSLVEIGRSLPGAIGARLSGGGFGGITVHLVQEWEAEKYGKALAGAYETRTGKRPDIFICHAADGAEIIASEKKNA